MSPAFSSFAAFLNMGGYAVYVLAGGGRGGPPPLAC
ncbi:cytochrome c-type biogenesis protein CcmD, interacts with CcmCE [Klebsiella variicola]|uniref:Cytochrome c-type biogenesis protein CcmD, interacts with CcmCE n=1 Tax=Klebsiella variicola TaxID=244366 RepID=A0A7H4MLU1_KLEVA|nr:cytochrome c-type biogenesis protein CcmD, interacts with CcmCE [Klebsiella variicola]